jgi:hypothetical protein
MLAAILLAAAAPAAAAEREGFLIGFTFGIGGSRDCRRCELAGGYALGGHAGWTVAPRVVVRAEGLLLGLSTGGGEEALAQSSLSAVAQFWPVRWFWAGGGLGVADEAGELEGDAGTVWVVQSGIDFRGKKRFGLDVHGRYEQRLEDNGFGRRGSVIVSMGFTWY